jgi:ribosomal subunit interface protein
VDVIFKGRHTEVLERFRKHASAKLAKIEKLDQKAIRVDVEITAERNPRLADRKERVELTVTSRGPAIRAEAAAEDRYAALDLAFAKLESRLRRACDRRKGRHGAHAAVRLIDLPEADRGSGPDLAGIERRAAANGAAETAGAGGAAGVAGSARAGGAGSAVGAAGAAGAGSAAGDVAAAEAGGGSAEDLVPIEVQGEGPLVVREKFHVAAPMSIDQALFEMELVGHDFFLFTDVRSAMPSVVYRRRGYQYGVIRLVEESADRAGDEGSQANGQARRAADISR